MANFDWVDRDRGILTKRDRRYLLGDLDDSLNDNERYQKRYQIRQRIRHAMFDFHFLYRYLSSRDIWMLWDGTDDWIYRSRRQRRRGEAPPYPEMPVLARCWRNLIAFFVYAQISTGIPEAESLIKWVIEEGVNKAVRRHNFERFQIYQEINSSIDWEIGDAYRLMEYLQYVGQQIPKDPDQAEEFLLELQQSGHLQHNHVIYLYQSYVNGQDTTSDEML